MNATEREAFLAERKTGLGSSDAAAACGRDPYKTPLRLYLEKRGEIEPDDLSQNMAVRFGVRLESAIADEYMERTGRTLHRVNQMQRHPSHPFAISHPDRRVVGERRIVEIKTVGFWAAKRSEDWGGEGTDLVPERYFLQAQHQMAVGIAGASYPVVDFAVLVAGQDYRPFVVPRNEAIIGWMLELEADMWRRIQEGDPPGITTVEDAGLVAARGIRGKVAYATAAMAELVGEIQHAKREIKALNDRIEAAKVSIMDHMRDAEELVFDDTPLLSWRTSERTTIDSKALKTREPDIYAKYAKTSTVRTFRLVDDD